MQVKISLPAHKFAPNCGSLKEARQYGVQKSIYHSVTNAIQTMAPKAVEASEKGLNYSDQPDTIVLLQTPLNASPYSDQTKPTNLEMTFSSDGVLKSFVAATDSTEYSMTASPELMLEMREKTSDGMRSDHTVVKAPVASVAGEAPAGGVHLAVSYKPKGITNIRAAQAFQHRADVVENIRGLVEQLAPQVLKLDGGEHDLNPAPNKIIAMSCRLPDSHLPEYPRLRDDKGQDWDVDMEFDPKTGALTFFGAETFPDQQEAWAAHREPTKAYVRYIGDGWYKDGSQRFLISDGKTLQDVTLTHDGLVDSPRDGLSLEGVPQAVRLAFYAKNES